MGRASYFRLKKSIEMAKEKPIEEAKV